MATSAYAVAKLVDEVKDLREEVARLRERLAVLESRPTVLPTPPVMPGPYYSPTTLPPNLWPVTAKLDQVSKVS